MVALLKSGRINNRLLCELATHKDFIKFLADIEIYVDGIATMQIQNLNALVDTVRHEIIERYRPGEDDPHLKVLQAAHISDDEYFSQMVRDCLLYTSTGQYRCYPAECRYRHAWRYSGHRFLGKSPQSNALSLIHI